MDGESKKAIPLLRWRKIITLRVAARAMGVLDKKYKIWPAQLFNFEP
jgi:hypothetical protein